MDLNFTVTERKHMRILLGNELDFLHQEKDLLKSDYDDMGVPPWMEKLDHEIFFLMDLKRDLENGGCLETLHERQKIHLHTILASEHASLEKRRELLTNDYDDIPIPNWMDKLDYEINLTSSILAKLEFKK